MDEHAQKWRGSGRLGGQIEPARGLQQANCSCVPSSKSTS